MNAGMPFTVNFNLKNNKVYRCNCILRIFFFLLCIKSVSLTPTGVHVSDRENCSIAQTIDSNSLSNPSCQATVKRERMT